MIALENNQLYDERLARLKKAVALEKPDDRVPISLYGTFFLKYGDPKAKLVDFVTRPEWADDMVVRGYCKLPAIDAGGPPVMEKVENMGKLWLAKIRIPGRELRDDDLWQIDEVGLMTVEDYDTILKVGWKKFNEDFLITRLGFRPEDLVPNEAYAKSQHEKYVAAGLGELGWGICRRAALRCALRRAGNVQVFPGPAPDAGQGRGGATGHGR